MVKQHLTKRLISFLIFTILIIPEMVYSASITLAWNNNTEMDLFGYKIYYGTSPDGYDSYVYVGDATSYKLSGLKEGVNYYIALTSNDYNQNESDYSDVITTKYCFSGTTFIIIPPFISAIDPCFDFASEENRFSLFQENPAVSNQIGEFNQSESKFYAACEYDLEVLGKIIHCFWVSNGNGNVSTDDFVFGDFMLETEVGEWGIIGIGIFFISKI